MTRSNQLSQSWQGRDWSTTDFSKFKKKEGSIPAGSKGKGKGAGLRALKAEVQELRDEVTQLKTSLITLEISTSMKCAKPQVTNDEFWKVTKENAQLAGIRNLIDYVARRNTKGMTDDQIKKLGDGRPGFTDAICKILNILQGGTSSQ